MKIVCISDTHGKVFPKLPDGDLLIHAGDLTIWGDLEETQLFIRWFASQPHKYKIFIAGNHDSILEKVGIGAFNVPDDVHYLENNSVELGGLKIWGSPFSREFGKWSFGLREPELKNVWRSIPDDTDVVVTHGPAWGVNDKPHPTPAHLGSESLSDRLLVLKPKLFVCGHIHGGYGVSHGSSTIHVNAAQLDEAYQPTHKPIIVDVT